MATLNSDAEERKKFLSNGANPVIVRTAPEKVYSFHLSTPEKEQVAEVATKGEHKKCSDYTGILLALFAGFVFTIGTILVKYMKHYHAFTIAVFRLQGILIPSVFMVFYMTRVKKVNVFEPISPIREDKKWKTLIGMLLRASIGCSALFLHLYSLQYLTVADVSVLSSTKPIFVTLAAFIFLGETCGIFPVLMALFAMLGVVVIVRPPLLSGQESYDTSTLIGAGFAMGAVLADTIVVVIIRSLKHIHVSLMMLVLGLWGTLQSTVCAYLVGELMLPQSSQDWVFAVGLAAVAVLNQGAMHLALQFEHANPIAVTRTMDFIFAFALQFFVMGISPDLFSLSGAAIIILCVLLTVFRKWLSSLPETHETRDKFWFVLR